MLLHTTIIGEGDPVVFLHTGLQTGETDFTYQSQHFSQEYQVFLPDLRGHGNSFSDDFSNLFEDSAHDLKETLDYYQVDSAHIVGCSLGGLVGIFFARQYPGKVKSLSLSGVTPEKPSNWKQMHRQEVEMQRQLLRNEEQVHYFNQLHNTNWREFIYLARNEEWYPFEHTMSLSDVCVPILFLAGENNPHEVKGASVYGESDHVHVGLLPFAGHLVHQDQPELYTKIVGQFIKKQEEEKRRP
ncbi:alpha/beta fold hydrolase [Halobacillus sp. BBL2006]|uniref:alpha/beta fold hydrolase n=1 Tax=Halobacillus sp. BBL2006 TaxID=1543706 RepID=UPI000543EAF4|nr:alpha/beta hydrolase [Halobacillus sp. BBL2006]KHE72710.1 alpha/beta hydrolase [Halobacillus sp. BBL2006]